MKTLKLNSIPLAAALVVPALFFSLPVPAAAQGRGPGNGPALTTGVAQAATTDEAKWLGFMREEEKLARDVYQQLGEKWNLNVFRNIALSEDRHYRSVGTLLSRYGISDPAANNPAGVYSDAKLTALFNELMAKGTQSAKDALEVGVLIEETDIADLETALQGTGKPDIKRVYTNLLNGSYHHLEAFQTSLEILCLNPAAN